MAATPGWYPEPSGAADQERYWDGRSWTPLTRPRPDRSRRTPLLVGAAALVLVLVGALTLALTWGGDDGREDPRDPVVGGLDPDDPAPGDPGDPVPTDPRALPPVDLADCPAYDDSVAVADRGDGRMHGGGLSFPVPDGFEISSVEDYPWPFPWGQDFMVADRPVAPVRWYSSVVAARLPEQPGYDSTKATAALVLTCVAESDLWYPGGDWEVTVSEGLEVDGHEGWLLGAEVELPEEDVATETTYALVVDMGPGADDALVLASTTNTEEGRDADADVRAALEQIRVGG